MHILVRGVWRREEPSVRRAWLLGNEAVLFSPERRATASQGPCRGDLVAFPGCGSLQVNGVGFPCVHTRERGECLRWSSQTELGDTFTLAC